MTATEVGDTFLCESQAPASRCTRSHPDDLSLADLEKYLCAAYGVRFVELQGFPPGSASARDGSPRWTCADVTPWLTGFFRGRAQHEEQFHRLVRLEAAMRPDATIVEHRERGLDRFVQVAVARVLMKRLP